MCFDMDITRNILVAVSALLLLSACSGKVDSASMPVLSAERTSLDLAEQEGVALKVELDGRDVTSSSAIRVDGTGLAGAFFSPEEGGVYSLVAEYDGKLSAPLTLTVMHSAPEVESEFEKHVCVAEFTGAWCVNCPEGYNKMMGNLSRPSMAKYADRIHFLAFHSDAEGTDTLAASCTQDVRRLFPKCNAFPAFAVDFRQTASGLLADEGLTLFSNSVVEAFSDEYPVYCGVAVSSSVSADGSVAEITVKVRSEYTNPFSVVVAVVQDRIVGMQKTSMFPEGQDDYIHNHVVRTVVTPYSGTFTGEKMTEDGFIHSGDEAVRTFTVPVDDRWVLDDTMVYALALDHEGCVNNMNVCQMAGGNSGYAYINE